MAKENVDSVCAGEMIKDWIPVFFFFSWAECVTIILVLTNLH